MTRLRSAAYAAALALPGTAWAADCARWADHAPGLCGIVSNDTTCANPANRVPGRCTIPTAVQYIDNNGRLIDNRSQSVLAPAGSFSIINANGTVASLVAAGGGNLIPSGIGNLVAAGGGNLVAAGGGNLVPGRALAGASGKRVFVIQR